MNTVRAALIAGLLLSSGRGLFAQGPAPAPLLPKGGIYLGAWVLPEGPKGTNTKDGAKEFGTSETEALEAQMGRKLALHIHYYNWDKPFPDDAMRDDAANGRVPVVSWESGGTLRGTIAGNDDAMLIERAKAAKAFGKPIFIRWMWEMNLMLTGHKKVYENADAAGSAKLYVDAWKHIWQVFHDQGATNVVWLWNPSAAAGKAEGVKVDAGPFYPGDEYVDWIGMDAYDRSEQQTGYVSVFSYFYDKFKSHEKPYMIVETGAFPASQPRYLEQVRTLSKSTFPLIQGFCYFDAPGHTTHPWSLTPEAVQAFAALGKDPYFQGHP